jgi:DNA-binding SARP family transcriptional activator
MQIGILGEFQVQPYSGCEWANAPSAAGGKLGSILAGWPGQVVEHATLIQAMWGSDPPRTAANTLQVHISRLRRMLGSPEVVQRRTRGYLLDVSHEDVDAEVFLGLLAMAGPRCEAGEFEAAEQMLHQALGLWRGTPFLDVHEPELQARRARLQELRSVAREQALLCRIRLAGDDFARDSAVADAYGLLALAPNRSRARALLVEALEGAGRDFEALRVRLDPNWTPPALDMEEALGA